MLENIECNDEGLINCNECNGTGGLEIESESNILKICLKCSGTGKLTWTEILMGRKKHITLFSTPIRNRGFW